MTAPYTDQFIELNDCRMHYQDWGNAGAPALLLVHGLTQTGHAFDGIAARLRERFHCLALDVRGRGESAWTPPETYELGQYAEDVTAFLDALNIQQTHYIGISMGGMIGMWLAAEAPEKFLSFALNDIGPELGGGGLKRISEYLATAPPTFSSMDHFIDSMLTRFPWLAEKPREVLAQAFEWSVRRNEDGSLSVKYDPNITAGGPTDPERTKELVGRMWNGLRALTCPILLIRGLDSQLLTEEIAAKMQAALPGMKFCGVPGVGHPVTLSDPPAWDALERFYR